ncbi:hypothetical protein Tco_0404158 [Tanacetum coccineum]
MTLKNKHLVIKIRSILKKAQRIKPTLYDGIVIAKELILKEESRSEMLDKQNDPISIKKKIKISPIDYSELNNMKEDFGKRFITKKELSVEQAFWLKHSNHTSVSSNVSHTHVKIEAPRELPKMSLVNENLKKLSVSNLETELLKKKDFVEKEVFDKLVKSYSTLEKHFISLELATQLNQEIFQKENSGVNQNAPTFNQLFEINELKAQSQEKDTVIRKLKEKIKSLTGKDTVKNVKIDIDELETINIELEHNLNAQLQEKVFAITTLKNELRKLKGKSVVNTAISKPSAVTIAPEMFKINLEPLTPKLLKNKDAHIDYIKHTQENADILRELVENARALSPLDSNLDSACKYVQRIQEVLVYVKETCPCLSKPSEKLVAVTPLNKDKRVRFADPITSSSNVPKQKS